MWIIFYENAEFATFTGYLQYPAAAADIRNILHISMSEMWSLWCPAEFSSVSIEFYAQVKIEKDFMSEFFAKSW